ncbi:uncharacterized protein LOC143983109 isoform X2 [Lithobates pipiens]
MPWYRQYFWLLLFGGIILLVAIISFAVICACRTRLSKSVVRIQKSLKRKKRDTSTMVTEKNINYSSGPSTVKLPNRTERDFAVSEIPITVVPPKMYAMIQKGSPQLPPRGFYPKHNAKEENTNSAVSEIPITVVPPKMYAMIQKGSPQLPPRGLYLKHNAKEENTNSVLPPKMYAMIQKGSPQLPPRGFYPKHNANAENTNSAVSEIPIKVFPPKMYAMIQKGSPQLPPRGFYPNHNAKEENTNKAISENPITVLPPKTTAVVHKGPPRVPPWGLYPEYYSKTENTNSHTANPNDRYSSASYDSVGSISGYSNYSTAAAASKEREYLEVIPDDDAISENPITVMPPKITAVVHTGPPRVPPWGLYPEYSSKTENANSHTPNPNDRYSSASYDSVGSISGYSNYSNAAAASKEREYLEVIPDDGGEGYDDVEIISSESDISYHWNNKP